VAKYDWGGKSAVVQLDSETELAGLHVDPKALVSWRGARAGSSGMGIAWPRVVSRAFDQCTAFWFQGSAVVDHRGER
jgi:hypothetical protein